MEIVALEEVEPPRPEPTDCSSPGYGVSETYLLVATAQDQAYRPVPGVIVEATVGVGGDEAMEIEVPAEGAEQVVAFQIGLTVLAVDKATGKAGRQSMQ